jgi:hypothetical protein
VPKTAGLGPAKSGTQDSKTRPYSVISRGMLPKEASPFLLPTRSCSNPSPTKLLLKYDRVFFSCAGLVNEGKVFWNAGLRGG